MFLLVPLSKFKNFHQCRTRVTLVSFVQHSCCTCVALVSHACHQCCTRVTLVSLVSGTRVVNQTRSFTIYKTGETFEIFHQLNFKSSHLIYLLQCRICQLHVVGKSETSFNVRLNDYRKNIKNRYSVRACNHFQNLNLS